jgi:hypothetical protein
MESKRQYTRIYLSLPMEFHVQLVDSNQFWESRATLKNISQGGLYFECGTAPQLKRGSVAEFTFTTEPANFGFVNSPVKAQAVVKRIEARVAGTENFGIALEFIGAPLFEK